jgi:hypothetical protein
MPKKLNPSACLQHLKSEELKTEVPFHDCRACSEYFRCSLSASG